jgi:hypothetical protein
MEMKSALKKGLINAYQTGIVRNPSKPLGDALEAHGMHALGARRSGVFQIPGSVAEKIRSDLLFHGVKAEFLDGLIEGSEALPDRVQALDISNDEKTGAKQVNAGRILIKSFPGRVISTLEGDMFHLNGMNHEVDLSHAASIQARGVLLVENKIAFDRIHEINFEIPGDILDLLIVFRGAGGIARQDASEAFIKALGVPVTVFPDYDPSGIANALSVPFYSGLLWPGMDKLKAGFDRSGCSEKFNSQLISARPRLEGSQGVPRQIWDLMRERGQGLVQEEFLRKPGTPPG